LLKLTNTIFKSFSAVFVHVPFLCHLLLQWVMMLWN